jgi:hypothetical protein
VSEAYDHLEEARAIARDLEAVGHSRAAEQIRESIDEGFSGTEIAMRLRFFLDPIASDETLSDIARARVVMLLTRLDQALR